jgi:16S rRNA U516 pseudouridylate synthase RsuA-like enzyme
MGPGNVRAKAARILAWVYAWAVMIVFNKPFGVLCQFTDSNEPPRPTLAGFGLPPDVYPAGRLDADSEGLLLLSDDGARIAQVSSPKFKWPKTYVVQVGARPTTSSCGRCATACSSTTGRRFRRVRAGWRRCPTGCGRARRRSACARRCPTAS